MEHPPLSMTSKDKEETATVDVVDIEHKEGAETSEAAQIAALAAHDLDHAEERSLVWKLDRHIAPVAMGLYLIAFLDRSNIGNAAVGGMTEDLNFPANGLSVATSVFYVTYVIFVRRLRPTN